LRHHLQRHPLPGMRRSAASFRLRRNELKICSRIRGWHAVSCFLIDAAAAWRDHSFALKLTVYEHIDIASLE
jgi:hypothetical protein